MTATQKFIEDAIEGGYKHGHSQDEVYSLLDPLAWQAVGKTRGWEEFVEGMDMEGDYTQMTSWESNWHHFISYLAEGKTIEEALSLI